MSNELLLDWMLGGIVIMEMESCRGFATATCDARSKKGRRLYFSSVVDEADTRKSIFAHQSCPI